METETRQIERVQVSDLRPHPFNEEIYGTFEKDAIGQLIEDIRQSRYIEPLIVTQDGKIISGHRRWRAAKALKLETVPVERRTYPDEVAEREALLLANRYRAKTTSQRMREAAAWFRIEAERASQRQAATRFGNISKPDGSLGEHGATRDKVAERVGFASGRTLQKAKNVMELADALRGQGEAREADALLRVLDEQSVDAAERVVKMPDDQRQAILRRIASGSANSVRHALRQLAQETRQEQAAEVAGMEAADRVSRYSRLQDIPKGGVDAVIWTGLVTEEGEAPAETGGRVAAHVLGTGGSFFVLCHQDEIGAWCKHLPEYGLDLYWCLSLANLQGTPKQPHQRKTNSYWQPILWFVRGAYHGKYVSDIVRLSDEQNQGTALVKRCTEPGQRVLVDDPSLVQTLLDVGVSVVVLSS